MQEQRALGDILMRHGVVTPEALEPLYAEQREKPVELFDLVVQNRLATDAAVAAALARECGYGFLESIDDEAIALTDAMRLPLGYARSHRLLVLKEDEESVSVVCGDPLDTAALDDVRATFGKRLVVHVAAPAVVNEAINRVYERQDTTGDLEGKEDVEDADAIDILESDDDAPIIRWVNSLFAQAAKERASDIHIEPEEKEVLVRYRVDGELYVARRARRQFMSSVIARVKIMAGLNIAEKRLPQDGRISLRIAGRAIDVRVSTVPTSRDHERIVMRLLNKTSVLLDLPDLGFSQRDFLLMDGLIHKPDGIILVTGPTGSGKTTTLYACINRINHPNINILTAEDPVEYEISGIHQVPVQPKIGLTFASALRAFLRQDPDVIMVGEIRDKETAEIAMHASMTGHLVLSTIHTNDAASAFTRLIQMEIEAFRVRSTVVGVLAQRLVRVLCQHCKEPYEATPYELEQLGIDPVRTRRRDERRLAPAYIARTADGIAPYEPVGWRRAAMPRLYRAKGCAVCDNKGFSGRLGIYELLLADDAVGEAVMQSSDAQSIRRVAQARGMDTLRDDGARKALAGITTVEEVVAATQDDMFDE
ncbi:MAG TPA: ATPase, T2SS/T4P/T4SS family [Polyangiaceae bacterium]|jgi:general secretion pathway protein E|nr:ATPase, T2SS/T4P/T4SS family [Polyangiaceae bacterium]